MRRLEATMGRGPPVAASGLDASPRTNRELNPGRPASLPASATRTRFSPAPDGSTSLPEADVAATRRHDESRTAPNAGHANRAAATRSGGAGGKRHHQRG